jgi:hypothetical protein
VRWLVVAIVTAAISCGGWYPDLPTPAQQARDTAAAAAAATAAPPDAAPPPPAPPPSPTAGTEDAETALSTLDSFADRACECAHQGDRGCAHRIVVDLVAYLQNGDRMARMTATEDYTHKLTQTVKRIRYCADEAMQPAAP